MAENAMVEWNHQFNVHEFDKLWELVMDRGPGVCSPWVAELYTTE